MPLWMQLLANGGILQNPNNGEGSDLGGGDNQPPKVEVEVEKPKDEQPKAETPRISDAEAKLLKEVMKLKESRQVARDELEALRGQLGDIDITEARQLLADKRQAEEKDLEAKGDYDRLKQRMAEEHQKTVTDLQSEIDKLKANAENTQKSMDDLTVGGSFGNSKFIGDELVLPSAKARALYGSHFDVKDGKIIGYDKPRGSENRTALVDAYGEALQFDDAMRKIIDVDPEKDHLMKSKAKFGAKSDSKYRPSNAQPNTENLSAKDKILAGLSKLK